MGGGVMLETGAELTNSRTGTHFTLLEMGDQEFALRYESDAPTRVPDFARHVHIDWDEEFEIISGQGRYWLDGEWQTMQVGDTVAFPSGKPHVHPMNDGDGKFEMIQRGRIALPDADRIRVTFSVLFSLFDRINEGRISANTMGYPKHPLKFAAIGKVLGDAGGFDAMLPIGAQRLAGATVGRLALAMGMDPIDDKWR